MPGSATPAAAAPKRSPSVAQPKSSDYLGVYWDKRRRRWKAEIQHNGKKHTVGQSDDEQAAARAYDTATRQRGGCVQQAIPTAADRAHAGCC